MFWSHEPWLQLPGAAVGGLQQPLRRASVEADEPPPVEPLQQTSPSRRPDRTRLLVLAGLGLVTVLLGVAQCGSNDDAAPTPVIETATSTIDPPVRMPTATSATLPNISIPLLPPPTSPVAEVRPPAPAVRPSVPVTPLPAPRPMIPAR